MLNQLSVIFSKKQCFLIAVSFVAIVTMQWLHFSLYFNQRLGIALIWSLVDWSVWFAIFLGTFILFFRKLPWVTHNQTQAYVAFAVFAGPVQIIVINFIYKLMFQSSEPLFDEFLHLMNKRWLQNLFVSAGFLFVGHHWFVRSWTDSYSDAKNTTEGSSLLLDDGKNTHKVDLDSIACIVSSKNYVSVHTDNEEIVIRSTLASIQEKLPLEGFAQISRSAIINLERVKKLEKYSKTSYQIVLNDGQEVNVSKNYLKQIVNELKQLQPSSLTS